MKKILIVLLLAFMLAACAGHDAAISNGNEVVWTSKDKTYTKNDLYNDLKSQDYTSVVISSILEKVADKEGLDLDSFKKEAEDTIQSLIDQGYESYITYYYGSKEEYIKNTITNAILADLANKEATEMFDSYKEEYLPYKAEMAYFSDKEVAQKVVDAVNSNEHTFAYAAQENGFTQAIEANIYTDTSELPVEVKEAILSSDKTGILDIVQSSTYTTSADGNSTITPRYYVINVISRNADEFKNEFIEYATSYIVNGDELITKYLKKYNVKIHDQRTYELLKDIYGDLS